MSAPVIVKLSPELAATTAWYAVMAHADVVLIDAAVPYNKRHKQTHRFDIADVRGHLTVTVPVTHPDGTHDGPLTWNDMRVSGHNRWWHTAANTLATAYGGTPWFADLWPRFEPLFSGAVEGRPVMDYLLAFDAVIRDILRLPARVTAALPPHCAAEPVTPQLPEISPYRQVRQDKLGFIPGLSILDTLFNLGPDDTRSLLFNTRCVV